jgi:hypothetical protein
MRSRAIFATWKTKSDARQTSEENHLARPALNRFVSFTPQQNVSYTFNGRCEHVGDRSALRASEKSGDDRE